MNRQSIVILFVGFSIFFACDDMNDKAVLGLPIELSDAVLINLKDGADPNFDSLISINIYDDSSFVSNAENVQRIEISNLYYQINKVTASTESIFETGIIGIGFDENTLIDTLQVLDSLNINEIKGQYHEVEISTDMIPQINSALNNGGSIYIFVEGTTSEPPVRFTLSIIAELIMFVGV